MAGIEARRADRSSPARRGVSFVLQNPCQMCPGLQRVRACPRRWL